MKGDNNFEELERLFAAARKRYHYDETLENGFEARVLAKIRGQYNSNFFFNLWAWRLIPALASIVLILGACTYIAEHQQLVGLGPIAGVNSEESLIVAYLTGE
ncbi:MAG TPA: hypothetical protein VK452_02060 [Dissulfurispiraceae bacterium]|nr:hypothetical protein [Dissulfurispiraceae bacterium]